MKMQASCKGADPSVPCEGRRTPLPPDAATAGRRARRTRLPPPAGGQWRTGRRACRPRKAAAPASAVVEPGLELQDAQHLPHAGRRASGGGRASLATAPPWEAGPRAMLRGGRVPPAAVLAPPPAACSEREREEDGAAVKRWGRKAMF